MATRKIKDAKDLETNELIFFKGHAKATYMSDGSTVEDAINNISTSGGETGPQGPQGEQGPKGEDGVGITSVVQTTTSSADGGSNVMTVTLSDGKTFTFTVKNGSKGSQGEQGPKGDKGDKGDTGAAGTNGTNGVSVSSVKQTTTSTSDGGTNVVTVTLSNGTTSTFNVKNGSKGSNGTNGTNGTNGATFTPSIDSAGNLSWTNNGGLTNPPTVNIKGPKGDSGEGGGQSVVTVLSVTELQPNVITICTQPCTSLYIPSFGVSSSLHDEYTLIFSTPSFEPGSLFITLPDTVQWANGIIPELEWETNYELSISRDVIWSQSIYKAVLTSFKPVE